VLPRMPVRIPQVAAASGVGATAASSLASGGTLAASLPHAATIRQRAARRTIVVSNSRRFRALGPQGFAHIDAAHRLPPGAGQMTGPRLRRTSRRTDAAIALSLARAAFDTDRPLIANLIITRRCNLSCGYCYEYDKVSPPVPLATLKERIDHIARLRAVFVTLTGGESLLHPEADQVVAYVRERGMVPFLNTNAYL